MSKSTKETKPTTVEQVEKKRERKVLTPAERIAKLEADLAAAKAKAEAKAKKQVEELKAKRGTLVVRRSELTTKIDALTVEIQALEGTDTESAEV